MSSILSFQTWLFCIKSMRSKARVELANIVNSIPFDFTHNIFVLHNWAIIKCRDDQQCWTVLGIIFLGHVGPLGRNLNFLSPLGSLKF